MGSGSRRHASTEPCSAPPRGLPQGSQLRVSAVPVTAAPAAGLKASQLYITDGEILRNRLGGERVRRREGINEDSSQPERERGLWHVGEEALYGDGEFSLVVTTSPELCIDGFTE